MARRPKPRWNARSQLWQSDVGESYVDKRGRRRRRTISFPGIGRKDDRKAREALQAHLDAADDRERQAGDPSVATICELYLEWVEANREPATLDAVAGLLGKFMAWPAASGGKIMARQVSAMCAEDLEHLLADMGSKNKPSYCAAMHAAVQAAFNWAAKRVRGRVPPRLIAANPFAGVAKPKVGRAPERYASRDELAEFLRWAWRHGSRQGTRDRPTLEFRFGRQLCLLLRLLAHTGARPGELCISGRKHGRPGFTWDKWNPDAYRNALGQRVGLITLEKHKTATKTKRPREIVVPPTMTRALERHRLGRWAHPTWVFTHRRGVGAESRGAHTAALGEPWTSHGLSIKVRKWRRRAIAAGVPLEDEGDNRFTAYRCRHTKITDLLMAGLSSDQAAALTGTSARMVETTYSHLVSGRLADLDDMARQVESARRKPGGK